MEHPRCAQQAGEAVVDTDGIVRSTRISGIQVIASLKVDTGLEKFSAVQQSGSHSIRGYNKAGVDLGECERG